MRKQQTIKFFLSKASQVKVRADYKKNNGLAKNCSLESVYRSSGIFNEKQASNVMAELYNNRIERDNQNVDVGALYRMYTYVYSGIPLKTSNVTVYLLRHFYI